MTRAPAVRLPSAEQAVQLKLWLEAPENFQKVKAAFESTTNFGKLESIKGGFTAADVIALDPNT